MKLKTLLLSSILISSLLLGFNSYASTTRYGSFTDFFSSIGCDPNFDVFCENEVDDGRKNKAGYKQDLSASDSYLANCEKDVVAEVLLGIPACEAARYKNASTVAANTAYNNGDYKKAFNIYKSLAELAQGDAIAQQRLGQMYYEGKGVPQDYNQAVHWYTKSYKHGYVTAKEYERILLRGRVQGFNPNNF